MSREKQKERLPPEPAPGLRPIELFRHFKRTDHVGRNFMNHQTDINEKMRSILIDWLCSVVIKFKLQFETLCLSVVLIDRYLTKKLVIRQKLQLIGVSALMLASKIVEIYAPEVRDMVYITDKAYTFDQVVDMTVLITQALKFRLRYPTSIQHLNILFAEFRPSADVRCFATFVLILTLPNFDIGVLPPHEFATACLCLAYSEIKDERWGEAMERFTGLTYESLTPHMNVIYEFIEYIEEGKGITCECVVRRFKTINDGEPMLPLRYKCVKSREPGFTSDANLVSIMLDTYGEDWFRYSG